MAEGPWRCSECGTINEPVANSCRTCGRWPSLFDLEESVVDEVHLEQLPEEEEEGGFEPRAFEPPTVEVSEFPVEPEPWVEGDLALDEEEVPETPAQRRRRLIGSVIVPLAFVVYIVIQILLRDR